MMTREQYYLIKLAEEASEVAQMALKTAQFGMQETYIESDKTNQQRLHGELNDLLAVVNKLNQSFEFGFVPCEEAQAEKVSKLQKWLDYSVELGFVKKISSLTF